MITIAGSASDVTASFSQTRTSAWNVALRGMVPYGASSQNHALVGTNLPGGSSGIVGSGSGYDFYANGGAANYGPFTGAHDAIMPQGALAAIEIGDILVDDTCAVKKNFSNVCFIVAASSAPRQRNVVGVLSVPGDPLRDDFIAAFVDHYETEQNVDEHGAIHYRSTPVMSAEFETFADTHVTLVMNALGEGQINVCGENGDIAQGDYITTSSMPGKGMRQADDLVHNYTVAKAREAVTFSSATEVKTVACIYLCG